MKLTVVGHCESPGMFRLTEEAGATLDVDQKLTAYQTAHVIADWVGGLPVAEPEPAAKGKSK